MTSPKSKRSRVWIVVSTDSHRRSVSPWEVCIDCSKPTEGAGTNDRGENATRQEPSGELRIGSGRERSSAGIWKGSGSRLRPVQRSVSAVGSFLAASTKSR